MNIEKFIKNPDYLNEKGEIEAKKLKEATYTPPMHIPQGLDIKSVTFL